MVVVQFTGAALIMDKHNRSSTQQTRGHLRSNASPLCVSASSYIVGIARVRI